MRDRFQEQLNLLNNELIKMGALCEDAILNATNSLLEKKEADIELTKDIEKRIDHKERDIESICMRLLLQQQPVARDLRTISSALKMISDMERIGDQAADIAEIVGYIKEYDTRSVKHIEEMAKETVSMVTESVDAFVQKDIQKALDVIERDDIVDKLFDTVRGELILLMKQENGKEEFCLDMLMIAKYLERIGDHATNIAEWVEYSLTGKHRKDEVDSL